MSTSVEFRSVTKQFDGVTVLDDIDLRIEAGEIFGIIGRSGAGKSTLVRLINALEKPSSGTILIDGAPITGISDAAARRFRLGIGMIFQQFNLFRSRTVAGNIGYPLQVAGTGRAERKRRVAELLEFVGLTDKARAYPDQLSGGQKQRVGIARALATSPGLLLADEATSALDPETTADVLRLLRKVNTELGVTIVVITHEMDVLRSVADRVAVLADGRIAELADTYEVFAAPRSAAARTFVGTRQAPNTLLAAHHGRIVTVDAVGIGPALAAAARAGVEFELVHGGLEAVQDRSYGTVTLALEGPDYAVDALVAQLREPR